MNWFRSFLLGWKIDFLDVSDFREMPEIRQVRGICGILGVPPKNGEV